MCKQPREVLRRHFGVTRAPMTIRVSSYLAALASHIPAPCQEICLDVAIYNTPCAASKCCQYDYNNLTNWTALDIAGLYRVCVSSSRNYYFLLVTLLLVLSCTLMYNLLNASPVYAHVFVRDGRETQCQFPWKTCAHEETDNSWLTWLNYTVSGSDYKLV